MPQSLFLSQVEGLADDLIKSKQFGLAMRKEEREARLQEILRAIQAERLGIEKSRHALESLKTGQEIAKEEERRSLFEEPPPIEGILNPSQGQPVPPGPGESPVAGRVRRGARAGLYTPQGMERLLSLGPEGFAEGERAGLLKSRVEAARGLSDLEAIEGARASKKDRVDYLRLKFGDSLADAYATNSDKFTDATEIMLSNVFPEELRLIALIKGGLLMAAKEKDPNERFNILAQVDENIMQAMKSLEGSKDNELKAFMTERVNAMVSLRDQVAGISGVEGGPGATLTPGPPGLLSSKRGFQVVPPPSGGPAQAPSPPSNDDHNKVVVELLRTQNPLQRFREIEGDLREHGFDTNSIEQRLVLRMEHKEPAQFLREMVRQPVPENIFGINP